jgi:tetratricopeptide (TPR) repeat protein
MLRRRLLFFVAVMVAAGLLVSGAIYLSGRLNIRPRGERKELLQLWEDGSYEEVYFRSQAALALRPMDYFLLTMNGFSAYQLGYSQITNLNAAQYFDDCIWKLRKALLQKNAHNDGRLYYVLGKAYSYKDGSYSDLTVKYLENARELSYSARDIPEYLGMAYKALGDYRSSVAAFSEALGAEGTGGPSGQLLLEIAESYFALDEFEMARSYLCRCIEISADSRSVLSARLLLAEILRKIGENAGAEKQLLEVIAETGENAEARYLLGELYFQQGDTARARAEWRLALRSDPAHLRARSRLSM